MRTPTLFRQSVCLHVPTLSVAFFCLLSLPAKSDSNHKPRRAIVKKHPIKRQVTPQIQPRIKALVPSSYEFEIPHPAQGGAYPRQVTMRVQGSGFKHGAVLLFNGKPVPTTFISTSQLEAEVPFELINIVSLRGDRNSPDNFHGTARVTVRNPAPRGGTSPAQSFSVRATPIG